MTSNRKKGALGLSIPVINPSIQAQIKLTPEVVVKWRAALPMADTGVSAKKLYIALSELNNTDLAPSDRFKIVEELRVPLKSICTTLKKHYIEQRKPLNEHKLTIANLRQSLLSEMTDNYKTIVEELASKTSATPEEQLLLTTAICRVLYYFNSLLICRYQLYSYITEGLWTEINLLYKYAKRQDILKQKVACVFSIDHENTTILASYAHLILLSATDPYQWRQTEQHSLNKVTGLWALEPTIYEHTQIPSAKSGIYIIDLDKDFPPIAYSFKTDPVTSSCIAFDMAPHVKHINKVLEKMSSNELKIKIQEYGNPEFSATKATLKKLIKVWSMQITRNSTRFPIEAKIKISFGLIAAHYYINDQKEFNSSPVELNPTAEKAKAPTMTLASDLPTFEVMEDDDEEEESREASTAANELNTTLAVESNKFYEPEKDDHYKLYDYVIDDMSPNGLCVGIHDGSFPPFHAGEIVVFKNIMKDEKQWSIGAIRWLKRRNDKLFQIGIQLISPYAKAGGVHMIRDNKHVGHMLRCLILPPMPDLKLPQMLITATPPFHSNKITLFVDNAPGIETTLTDEIDSTDMYYQFAYVTKEVIAVKEPTEEENLKKQAEQQNNQASTEFDNIWKDL